VGIEIKGIMYL